MNHEAWAIPYGDLITLLLAFFVVMYAISSVNEGKYRVLADSLVAAFRGPPRSMEPVQVGAFNVRADQELETGLPRLLVPLEVDGRGSTRIGGLPADLLTRFENYSRSEDDTSWVLIERLKEDVVEAMAPLIEADMISVQRVSFWLEVEINTNVLFDSGSARVAPDANPVIQRLASLLSAADVRVQVEGHTDSVPISTAMFPSNWELSAVRAASVVHLLVEYGMDPARMAAVGYGAFRPVGDNATAEGRRKNRRVLLVVLSGREQSRELVRAPEKAEAVDGDSAT